MKKITREDLFMGLALLLFVFITSLIATSCGSISGDKEDRMVAIVQGTDITDNHVFTNTLPLTQVTALDVNVSGREYCVDVYTDKDKSEYLFQLHYNDEAINLTYKAMRSYFNAHTGQKLSPLEWHAWLKSVPTFSGFTTKPDTRS